MISMITTTPAFTPTPQERKIHEAAESFVGTFFAQMVEQMFQEAHEGSEEEGGFERETYDGFLATALGNQLGKNHSLVAKVEDQMRRQAGLETLADRLLQKSTANKAYKEMVQKMAPQMPRIEMTETIEETAHVRAPAA